jgi:spermidine/putrescine transport system substrate-binding protein
MRKILLMALAMVLLAANMALAADKELRIFIWSEYMPEDYIPNFEKVTGINVRVDHYESMEEMIAKLQAGGVSQYDIVVPSDYVMPTMINLGLLAKIDHAKVPNIKNLDPLFVSPKYDAGNTYSVAYQWGTLGMMYKKGKVPGDPPSWSVMFDEKKQVGPFVLIDSVREMLGSALVYMGKDVNTTDPADLKALANLMLKVKKSKYFQGFEVGTGARSKVVAGTAVAAIVYNGDGLRAVAEDATSGFANPAEGAVMWVDSMCIPAKAPNPEAALKFINYVMDAKNGADLSNWTQYPTPNKAAMEFITPDDLKNPAIYPPKEYIGKLQLLRDLGKDNRLYDELWTMIKTR